MVNHGYSVWLLAATTILSIITEIGAQSSSDVSTLQKCRVPQRNCPLPWCDRRPTEAEKQAPGIGFALSMAHGTAAIRYHNGSYQNSAFVEGDQAYIKAMNEFVLAGPDRHLDTSITKVFAKMVSLLRVRTEAAQDDADFVVSAVALTLPQPIGLYYEEANVILGQLSIRNIIYETAHNNPFNSMVSAMTAAYAGVGMGLCQNYLDIEECELQEGCLPFHHVLHIDLSAKSLSGSFGEVAAYHFMLTDPTFVNTSLGIDTLTDSSMVETSYWQIVRRVIRDFVQSIHPLQITFLILTGTSAANPKFRSTVKDALQGMVSTKKAEYARHISHILDTNVPDDDGTWTTARGAAEIAKRRQEGPFLCSYDDRTPEQKSLLEELIAEWQAEATTLDWSSGEVHLGRTDHWFMQD